MTNGERWRQSALHAPTNHLPTIVLPLLIRQFEVQIGISTRTSLLDYVFFFFSFLISGESRAILFFFLFFRVWATLTAPPN